MKFVNETASIFIPDGVKDGESRTTHLWVGAHHDDTEIAAFGPILECYQSPDSWFSGITLTNGAGSPRAGKFASYTDEEMTLERHHEQDTAAIIGKYAAQYQLSYPSSEVKRDNPTLVNELAQIILECKPDHIYTHNLADKHPTHVAVALRLVSALRLIQNDFRPKEVIALEVWRNLDWVSDEQKVILPTSGAESLESALLTVYQSQVGGGKRYDLATIGRRHANATFFEAHGVDKYSSTSFGIELTDLIYSNSDPFEYMEETFIQPFIDSVKKNINSCK